MAQSSVMGVITQVCQPESGTTKNGNPWIRQTIIVQKITNSPYESFVALEINGQRNIESIRPVNGMIGEFFFEAESREGSQGGRWFTSLSCYKFKPFQMQPASAETASGQMYGQHVPQQGYMQQDPMQMQQNGWGQQQQQGGFQAPQGGYNPSGQNGNW